jgi:hypothetical protein
MARRSEEEEDEAIGALSDAVPGSGPRKKEPSEGLQLLLAEFHRRAAGLTGAELDAEVDRFVERMIERHIAALPTAIGPLTRATLTEAVRNDPALVAMIEDMRSAAGR